MHLGSGVSMSLLSWIILGGLAGWIASALVHESQGCLMNVIIGVMGALLGGVIFHLVFGQEFVGRGFFWSLLVAVVGSLLLLGLVRAVRGMAGRGK